MLTIDKKNGAKVFQGNHLAQLPIAGILIKTSVSIWAIGRLNIPPKYLPYIKGEADLVYKKGKFYLFQTVEVPEEDVEDRGIHRWILGSPIFSC